MQILYGRPGSYLMTLIPGNRTCIRLILGRGFKLWLEMGGSKRFRLKERYVGSAIS